ncbi:lipoate--protein ligase family protein [bacterium]|nr:lipoate--protein ligase family protein [bacterium]
MTNHWRFLDTGSNSAYYNMALDEALLLCSSKTRYPILRLFGWSSPSVSLGYFQKPKKSINIDFCREEGIEIVRRITGGRAVYHDKELTYSIIIPRKSKFFKNSNIELYKELSKGLLSAFQKLGIDGKLKRPKKGSLYQNKANCFSTTSAYEITVNGKKIVGSAQKWSDYGILQQGSILLDFDLARAFKVFNSSDCLKSGENGFITLSEVLGFIPDKNLFIKAIRRGFEETLEIKFIDSELLEFEIETAKNLLSMKYCKEEWNYKKN